MDLTNAQRLMMKIQALLDTGNVNDLSRLEKDLMKSYILQLYEAVVEEKPANRETATQHAEIATPKITRKEMPVQDHKPETFNPVTVRPEPETPPVSEPAMPKRTEIPVEIRMPVHEPAAETPRPEPRTTHMPVTEPVRKPVQVNTTTTNDPQTREQLVKLFELPSHEGASGRTSHVPVESIESAMGLNERIFTLNELFGGDKGLFDTICGELNQLGSYSDAKNVLMNGPAVKFDWTHPERVKMAEEFIRIVVRRYPKN